MGKNQPAYSEVNKKWKETAKVIFGNEIGELKDYSEWLYENNGPRITKKSSLSGKESTYSYSDYALASKWLAFEEVDFEKKYDALNINEIKDIDSILEAISGRIYYTGNMVLGDSGFVEKSTNIVNSYYVFHSEQIASSKNIAYSTFGTYGENIFGGFGFGWPRFCIKSKGIVRTSRCFEVIKADLSSDCYYSHGISGCAECMFCFNLRSKKYAIGNLELPPDKYAQIKAKLIDEMHKKLVNEKRLPTLIEIASKKDPEHSRAKEIFSKIPSKPAQERKDKSIIEKAFSNATKIVLGKEYSPIDQYAKWLQRHTNTLEPGKSAISGEKVMLPNYADFSLFPKDRLLTFSEADFIGERLCITKEEAESFSLKTASELISKIAYFSPIWPVGIVKNNIDCPINIYSNNCYKNITNVESKFSAYSYLPRDSEYIFGSNEARSSSFCINCYHSARLRRCFEMDCCNDCSDCYFCHNCENLDNCMFCFNIRNKRYAIGNVEISREKYLKIKEKVLAQLRSELEKKNEIRMDIFNLMSN